jgi:hypothetical protein
MLRTPTLDLGPGQIVRHNRRNAKREGKRPLTGLRCVYGKMTLKWVLKNDVDWIHLAQDRTSSGVL